MSQLIAKKTIRNNTDRAIALLYSCGEESDNQLFWETINEPHKSILEECYYLNEEGKYNQLEQITNSIKYNKISYIKLGMQLYQVKYYRLYKNNYKSFKDYCEKAVYYPVWRANQVIESSSVAIQLIKAGFNIIPQNEAQARLLIKLNEEELIRKWQEVLDTYEVHKITANRIENIVFGEQTFKKGSLKLPIQVIREIEVKASEYNISVGDFISKIITGEITINDDGSVETKLYQKSEMLENPSTEMVNRWEKDLNKLAFQDRNKVDDFAEDLADEIKNTVTDLKMVIKKCFIKSFLQPFLCVENH
ncbi:hypothetical protein GM3708_3465 [Geminocystis sp. NIES-3708]|uniref:hypothetical protein n=1 Tax=Geminocystis sp. NIES-3708 TaxID=1615909 RepID=UPI0005FCBCBE|nr:hypothetical protein [Geminocystis sp. NIES-3708]BAQ63059.1 hypothetical protein GM3708_3465 [Geminocystis sp. NIES-3708]